MPQMEYCIVAYYRLQTAINTYDDTLDVVLLLLTTIPHEQSHNIWYHLSVETGTF